MTNIKYFLLIGLELGRYGKTVAIILTRSEQTDSKTSGSLWLEAVSPLCMHKAS